MYLKFENVSFKYSGNKLLILQDLNFSVEKSKIAAICGASGSGKSTILRLIAGLEKAISGIISIDGEIVNSEKLFVPPEKRGVGMVFQDYALFPHLSVEKNIAYGIHREENKKEIIHQMLELTSMLNYQKAYPHQLSGGQQQRIAIARSLAAKPKLLLLDEPFSNLDTDLKKKMRIEIKEILKKAKITAIFVTHDLQDVESLSEKTIKID